MAAMMTSNATSIPAATSSYINADSLRSFAVGLDFVYLTPLLCVCRTPRTEAEADRLSTHFHSQHPHNHKIINCSAYPVNKTGSSHAAASSSGTGKSNDTAQCTMPSGGNDGEEINTSPSQLTSTRYFESAEDYRGPISLKQLMHCVYR